MTIMVKPRLYLLLTVLTTCVLSQQEGDGANAEDYVSEHERLSVPVSTLAINTPVFERADTDSNGIVDKKEFTAFIASLKNALDPFFVGNLPIHATDGRLRTGIGGKRVKVRTSGSQKFWSGFGSGILTIWATEIGDKTFFIAAILSMKRDRIVVFSGAIGALIVMTVLSVVMGVVATKFLPPNVTHYLGGLLFVVFGVKMLFDARGMDAADPSEELTEVEEELMGKKNEDTIQAEHVEEEIVKVENTTEGMMQVFSQAFLMTLLAEWGDRSQIATVTLSATKDAFGVTLGAILGHSMCTGLAVVGGKLLATRISERTVTFVGGIIFVLFAMHSFITEPSMSD